jgi:hypothetical protein
MFNEVMLGDREIANRPVVNPEELETLKSMVHPKL